MTCHAIIIPTGLPDGRIPYSADTAVASTYHPKSPLSTVKLLLMLLNKELSSAMSLPNLTRPKVTNAKNSVLKIMSKCNKSLPADLNVPVATFIFKQ